MNKKTILIVEDELPASNALEDVLVREGFNILKAFNGEEGLRKIIKDRPDLIVLDIIMPKMDGLTMLKELEKNKEVNKIPVVILSNKEADRKTIEDISEDENYCCYLVKSDWKIKDVVEKIRDVLKNS